MENVIFMFIGAALALAGVAYFGRGKSGKLPESKQDYKMPEVRPPRPTPPSPKVTGYPIKPQDCKEHDWVITRYSAGRYDPEDRLCVKCGMRF
jgi:hypothetical protein